MQVDKRVMRCALRLMSAKVLVEILLEVYIVAFTVLHFHDNVGKYIYGDFGLRVAVSDPIPFFNVSIIGVVKPACVS